MAASAHVPRPLRRAAQCAWPPDRNTSTQTRARSREPAPRSYLKLGAAREPRMAAIDLLRQLGIAARFPHCPFRTDCADQPPPSNSGGLEVMTGIEGSVTTIQHWSHS